MCNCKNCENFKKKEESAFDKFFDETGWVLTNFQYDRMKMVWNAGINAVLDIVPPFLKMADCDGFKIELSDFNKILHEIKKLEEK